MTLLIQMVQVQLARVLRCHQFTLEMLFPACLQCMSKIVSWLNYVDFPVQVDFN